MDIIIIFFIISLSFLISGIILLQKANKIKVTKNIEHIQIEKQYKNLKKEFNKTKEEYYELCSKKDKLLLAIKEEKEHFDKIYEDEKNKISEQINLYKQNTSYAGEQYLYVLEQNYEKAEQEHDRKIKALETKKQEVEKELDKLRESLSAGVQASLREREKEENLEFYKLSISSIDLQDVVKLENVKLTLHQPVVLSKLIWSTYFQKQTTEMCNRILGTKKICGIYKITNLKTQQCYIGQSVDVAQRWKDHCKCGLGIEASATNKLYNSMQKYGIYSFSFELMEECPREQLNEKEKFWIELYQSNIYGFNSTKGNG